MSALRWSRRALLFFAGMFLIGVALSFVVRDAGLLGASFWLCLLSLAGAVAASIAALAIQLASLFRRQRRGRIHHG